MLKGRLVVCACISVEGYGWGIINSMPFGVVISLELVGEVWGADKGGVRGPRRVIIPAEVWKGGEQGSDA